MSRTRARRRSALRRACSPACAACSSPTARLVGIWSGGAWLAERLQRDLRPGRRARRDLERAASRRLLARAAWPPAPTTPSCRSRSRAATSSWSTTCSTPGGRSAPAINELYDFGRPASVALAVLVDRGGRELPIEAACAVGDGSRCRPAERLCARRATTPAASASRSAERRTRCHVRPPQPAAQPQRRTDPSAVDRGPAGGDPAAHPRHRRHLPQRQRPRGQEGAAAARQERLQPVLRELDAHPHHLRDRRQAALGRRHQPRHRALVARPRARACSTRSPTCRRCTPTCSSCATRRAARPT